MKMNLVSRKATCELVMMGASFLPPLIPRSAVIIRGENDGRVGWGVFAF
jgi:hypothetical protein